MRGMLQDPSKTPQPDMESDGNPAGVGALIMKLFDARTSAHVQHLTTRSYATHKALEDFYSGIVDIADSIAEAWQGTYEQLLSFPNPAPLAKDPLTALRQLRTWIEESRGDMCDDTEIQNLIDEATALIDSTIYKLKFLA